MFFFQQEQFIVVNLNIYITYHWLVVVSNKVEDSNFMGIAHNSMSKSPYLLQGVYSILILCCESLKIDIIESITKNHSSWSCFFGTHFYSILSEACSTYLMHNFTREGYLSTSVENETRIFIAIKKYKDREFEIIK